MSPKYNRWQIWGLAGLLLFSGGCADWRVEWMFHSALENVSDGEYDRARNALYRIASDFPDHPRSPEALFLRADLLQSQLHHDEAAELAFKELLQRFPESLWAQKGIDRLVDIYMRDGEKNKQALRLAEFYLKKYPHSENTGHMHRTMARLFINEGHFQQAAIELRKALQQTTETSSRGDLLVALTEVSFFSGALTETIALANRVTAATEYAQKINSSALYLKALAQEELGELQSALNTLFSIQDTYPNPRVVAEKIVALQDRLERRNRER